MQNATRGGDLLFHKLALLKQNFGRATAMSVLAGGGLLAGIATTNQAAPILEVYKKLFQAHSTNFFNFGNTYATRITVGWGDWARTGNEDYILQYINQDLMPLIWPQTVKYLQFAGITAAVTFGATWYLFYYFGKKAIEDKHVDGQEEVNLKMLRSLIQKSRILPPQNFLQRVGLQRRPRDEGRGLMLAGVEIPPKFVCRNLLITGGVGTGKSTAIFSILDDLRARKIKTVVYDPHGEFSQKFYRKGKDYLLNPTDKNCVSWDVFSDVVTRAQLVSMIKIMIPEGEGDQIFFTNSARQLLSDLMLYARAKDMHISDVYKIASTKNLQELYDILCTLEDRAESKGPMDPAAAEQAQGIRSTLTTSESVRFLDLFPRNKPFSIRKWMEKDEDSWLFITSQAGDVHELILPYISTTIDVALEAGAGKQSRGLRRALVIDEIDSAGRLPKLHKQLAQLRKFGVSIVLGFQDVNQLLDVYGEEKTATIVTNCQTKLICRFDNAKSSQRLSELIGTKEVEQTQMGASWGAADMRDGESLSRSKVEKPIIPARAISTLEDGEGYLKLPGTFPPCKIKIPHKQRPDIHGGYEEADGLLWDVEGQKETFRKQKEEKAKKGEEKVKNETENETVEEEEF